jgi:hypothetical protein
MPARYEPERTRCTRPPPGTRVLAARPVTSAFPPGWRYTNHTSLRGAEITQDSASDVPYGMSTRSQCLHIQTFLSTIRSQDTKFFHVVYIAERVYADWQNIAHRFLVDAFSSRGKHIYALSKHTVKMVYMDNWRSAPSILEIDAA